MFPTGSTISQAQWPTTIICWEVRYEPFAESVSSQTTWQELQPFSFATNLHVFQHVEKSIAGMHNYIMFVDMMPTCACFQKSHDPPSLTGRRQVHICWGHCQPSVSHHTYQRFAPVSHCYALRTTGCSLLVRNITWSKVLIMKAACCYLHGFWSRRTNAPILSLLLHSFS